MTRNQDKVKHNNLHSDDMNEESDDAVEKRRRLKRCLPNEEASMETCDDDEGSVAITPEETNDNDVCSFSDFQKLFSDGNVSSYFTHETQGFGKSYIASCQLTKTSDPSFVSELDTELHLLLASLLLRITKGDRVLLSKVMSCVVKKKLQDRDESTKHALKHLQIPLPSSENDFRKYLEGSSAILSKVPLPTVRVTASGDACVLPSDAIHLYFGLGLKPHMIRTEFDIVRDDAGISTVWQTKKALEALRSLETKDDSTHKILLADWSDGFDPNGTNKNNRGSVHAITCSLFSEGNRNDRDLSFLVGVSHDKSDHLEVRRAITNDLKALREPTEVFDGTKMMTIQVMHIVTIQDRPERSASTGHGYPTGTYNMVWGMTAKTNRKLISCSDCYEDRNNKVRSWNSRRCLECHDWDWLRPDFPVPVGYPTDLGITRMQNRNITFEGMNDAAHKAHYKMKTKQWTKANAATYLKVEGFHQNLINDVTTCTADDELENVLPPVWTSNGDFTTHIDTIMHQVFLGVTQTVGMLLKDVLSSCGLFSQFHQSDHQLRIVRSLQLDWCKTWIFGSSKTPFGPWVSENTLACARLMKSTHCILHDIQDEDM